MLIAFFFDSTASFTTQFWWTRPRKHSTRQTLPYFSLNGTLVTKLRQPFERPTIFWALASFTSSEGRWDLTLDLIRRQLQLRLEKNQS